jgi:gamma-glutamylputrescine oxidase
MLTTETREHTPSYYAATANWQTHYPKAEGHVTADVCIVGGGFSGVSTALHLAEKGYKVVLLEANRISWGASGRNGGQVISGIGDEPPEKFKNYIGEEGVKSILKTGHECVEIIKERVEKYNIDCDLAWGYIYAATKPRQMHRLKDIKTYQESVGYPYPVKIFNESETRHILKSDRYCGAYVNEHGWGHVHPLNLCIGEARAAENLGTRIFEQSRVTKITHSDKPTVHTEHGSVQANYVVLCGEAYMGDLVPELYKNIFSFSDSVITTEPLGERANSIITTNWAACDANNHMHYYRLTADKRLLFGGSNRFLISAPSNPTAHMRNEMLSVFPQLKDVKIDYTWRGTMGFSLNRIPQMGRINNNVYYVQGYTGHGVAPTHAMGKVLAEAISGNAERFDVFSKIKPITVPGGYYARQATLAIGLLYYRLLDIL